MSKQKTTKTVTRNGESYTVTKTVYKGFVKIEWVSGSGSGVFKLSYPQWEAATKNKPKDRADAPGETRRQLDTGYGPARVDRALVVAGLVQRVAYTLTHYGRTYYESVLVLTDLGEVVLPILGECPKREDWPQISAPKPRSPENIQLTSAQQRMLNEWPRDLSDAVPVGGTRVERGRWISDRYYPGPTIRCLLEMGLVEPGVCGMNIQNGRLMFDSAKSPGVALVYRMTIHGALFAS